MSDRLGMIVYGPGPGGSYSQAWGTADMAEGAGALAFLPVTMNGDGKTQIVQLWNNNGRLAMITYGPKTDGSYGELWNTGDMGEGAGALAFLPVTMNGDGKTQIVQLWDYGPPPLPPVNLSPNGGKTGRKPTLSWADPAKGKPQAADDFLLELTVNGNTSSPPPTNSASYTVPNDLPYAASVNWRVRGRNPNGLSGWSQASFSVENEPTCETTYAFYLNREPVWEGPIPYTGVFGQGIIGKLISIINPNPFRVGLLLPGHSTSELFSNPKAARVLQPGGSTTPQDQGAIFGSSSPSLPITIVAGIEAGAAVPDRVRLDIHYSYQC
jgi:hypothetical protein